MKFIHILEKRLFFGNGPSDFFRLRLKIFLTYIPEIKTIEKLTMQAALRWTPSGQTMPRDMEKNLIKFLMNGKVSNLTKTKRLNASTAYVHWGIYTGSLSQVWRFPGHRQFSIFFYIPWVICFLNYNKEIVHLFYFILKPNVYVHWGVYTGRFGQIWHFSDHWKFEFNFLNAPWVICFLNYN